MAFKAAQWWKNADRSDWQNACNALEDAFAFGYYGAFQDTTTQTLASTTVAYPMTFDTTDETYGVTIGSPTSRIVIANPGTYNIQWSGQFQNTNNANQDAAVWIRRNGVDVTGSTGVFAVPGSHGQVSGHTLLGWNYVITFAANEYIEFMWHADSTAVTLQSYSAGTNPTTPSTSCLVLTVTQVGAVR
jgi:hypothetical protein